MRFVLSSPPSTFVSLILCHSSCSLSLVLASRGAAGPQACSLPAAKLLCHFSHFKSFSPSLPRVFQRPRQLRLDTVLPERAEDSWCPLGSLWHIQGGWAVCPSTGHPSVAITPWSLQRIRLLLRFPTANTEAGCSACAPACSDGGISKGRAAMALLRDKFGRHLRWTHSSSCLFPSCVGSSVSQSGCNPHWVPPGSMSSLETPSAGGYSHPRDLAKSRENKVKAEKLCKSKKNLLSPPSSSREMCQEKSKVKHNWCAKTHGCPPAFAAPVPSTQPLPEPVNLSQQHPWLETVSPSVKMKV